MRSHSRLALGCWAFGGSQWGGQEDDDSLAAMAAAFRRGMTHFDTAIAYGSGRSERLVGKFLHDQQARDQVLLATKGNTPNASKAEILDSLDQSLLNLRVDHIDLYYIHWPRQGKDMRPVMEGLEAARARGKIRAVGVSNFSVEQMGQVAEVGRIDAHQFCYNLFWRYPEREVLPYCREHGIAAVAYSSIAQGILAGKFPRQPTFQPGDQRPMTVLFDPKVWPHLYEATQQLKALAAEVGRPMEHLAIRWVAAQPGITSVLIGARNAEQVERNVAAVEGEIPPAVFERMAAISHEAHRHIPDAGNIFRYYP